MRLRFPFAVIVVVVGTSLLAGCSGGPAPTRDASGANPRQSCAEQTSWSIDMTVANFLPVPVSFGASEVDCYDWSGRSTPIEAFDGLRIEGGGRRTVRLEPSWGSSRNWRLTLYPQSFASGSARFSIPKGQGSITSFQIVSDTNRSVWGVWEARGDRISSSGGLGVFCRFAPITATSLPPTSGSDLLTLKTDNSDRYTKFGVASFEGWISFAWCEEDNVGP